MVSAACGRDLSDVRVCARHPELLKPSSPVLLVSACVLKAGAMHLLLYTRHASWPCLPCKEYIYTSDPAVSIWLHLHACVQFTAWDVAARLEADPHISPLLDRRWVV